MAPRPAWKGYLKLSLVTCAVELTNVVTHTEKVSFRVLNRKTGNTVKRIYVDAETGKPLDEGNEIKGYELDGGDFVHIEEDEIAAVQIESSHTMALDGFVDKASIQQIYLDTPYYAPPTRSGRRRLPSSATPWRQEDGWLARIVLQPKRPW